VWCANVLVYVDHVHKETRVHGNSKKTSGNPLPLEIPLLGPVFLPPEPSLLLKYTPHRPIKPTDYYLRNFTVVHPFYMAKSPLLTCPGCVQTQQIPKITWRSWSNKAPRLVHELDRDSLAMGYTFECSNCEEQRRQHHWTMTNAIFWKEIPYWKVPGEVPTYPCVALIDHSLAYVPFFLERSAISRQLYNVIAEFRLTEPAAAIVEHVKRKFINHIIHLQWLYI
jgi:ribosomal protein L32